MAKLRLKYDGTPESARIITDSGDVVDDVTGFKLIHNHEEGCEYLIIRVRLLRSYPARTEHAIDSKSVKQS